MFFFNDGAGQLDMIRFQCTFLLYFIIVNYLCRIKTLFVTVYARLAEPVACGQRVAFLYSQDRRLNQL
jgi:hypothetical protein